jgi:hypothetical protein
LAFGIFEEIKRLIEYIPIENGNDFMPTVRGRQPITAVLLLPSLHICSTCVTVFFYEDSSISYSE